jgi:hypothetical protein
LRPLQKEGGQATLTSKLTSLVDALFTHDDSWPFREPVDTALVPDYLDVVKVPVGE